ncbi:hypothetical protein CAQUA_03520 [Corynebacterium aquatimens]|uniref:Uncharacterized protein n=1 Tax=Corynebacterium aquatimens TaxID=1190508 RepID=A0A931GW30_9CORY|nr:hypothetical protein [Corynebacterium aquatimens]WJY65418.1 hypothetical protein CAQUA_03520 [Corynebacterium aquatimens]
MTSSLKSVPNKFNFKVVTLRQARAAVERSLGYEGAKSLGFDGLDGGDVFLILPDPDRDGAHGYVVEKSTGDVYRDIERPDVINRVWRSSERKIVSF